MAEGGRYVGTLVKLAAGIYPHYLFGLLLFFISDVSEFSGVLSKPFHIYILKTKVRHLTGGPIDSNRNNEEQIAELSSKRWRSAAEYYESIDFSRCIFTGRGVEFTLGIFLDC